ncbi:MAG: hypothetical protein K6F90_08930 [Lachnospiraceae bacterium]|nr:hypothetical protein [Lachnospiraceae bacterium]
METALTERDKKLLYILGFIIIAFVFGWVIITPMVKKINLKSDEIEVQQELRSQNEVKVMGVDSAESLIVRFESDLEGSLDTFYEPMDSSEIDKLFTTYILGFGLYAKDLSIQMPAGPVSETPYVNSDLGILFAAAEAADTSDSFDDDSSDSEADDSETGFIGDVSPLELYQDSRNSVYDTTYAGVTCANVMLVMTGNPVKEQALLDDILTNPSVRVTGFAWDDLNMIATTNEDGSVDIRENTDRQLTINLNVYMH